MERNVPSDKILHSRFTTTPSSIFETAGITLKQAQVLEYLFLVSQATYRGIAHQFDTLPINVGRSVGALLRRGMARRIGEQAVTVDRAVWRLRVSYAAWDAWLTAKAARQQGGT
jgi:DNA-binding MarR family transcriptional regulator